MSDYYLIAEIKSLFETRGFVNVIPYSDSPDRFFMLKDVYIDVFGDKKKFSVEKVIHTGKLWSVKFLNFNSAREVEFLIGKRIFVDQENLIGLEENTYFIHDLIGSRVFRNDLLIGIVADVLSLPANDVYVIKDLSEGELLIPAITDYVESFDPINKILVLRPGGDLFEDEDDED